MEAIIDAIEQSWWLGVPAAAIVGLLLGLNPLALPIMGTAVVVGSAGEIGSRGAGVRMTAAFGAGMTVVYTGLGLVASRVDVIDTRVFRPYAGIGYTVLGICLLGLAGFLALRRADFCASCERRTLRTPTVGAAFLAGIPGGFVNCPACAGIALGVAAASATVAIPLYGAVVMLALGIGHAAALVMVVWFVGERRIFAARTSPVVRWLGVALLVAAAGYFFRQASFEGLLPSPKLP